MLLAIDIGNTNIKLGVWDGRIWRQKWRLRAAQEKTADEYGVALKVLLREHDLTATIDQVVMVSVVPALTATFAAVSRRYLHQTALEITLDVNTGIRVLTDDPAAVGADRLVNVAAAHYYYPGPAIVIDMGTATKFEVLTAAGEFHGGVIAPGLRIISDALTQRAAKLSQVALEAPPHTIGRNTVHAMQSGLIFGYVGLVEGILHRLFAEHPDPKRPIQVIGTGGLIGYIAPHTRLIDRVDPTLTLSGLRLICERLET